MESPKQNKMQFRRKEKTGWGDLLFYFHPSWEEEIETYALQPEFTIIQGPLILELYLEHSITYETYNHQDCDYETTPDHFSNICSGNTILDFQFVMKTNLFMLHPS